MSRLVAYGRDLRPNQALQPTKVRRCELAHYWFL